MDEPDDVKQHGEVAGPAPPSAGPSQPRAAPTGSSTGATALHDASACRHVSALRMTRGRPRPRRQPCRGHGPSTVSRPAPTKKLPAIAVPITATDRGGPTVAPDGHQSHQCGGDRRARTAQWASPQPTPAKTAPVASSTRGYRSRSGPGSGDTDRRGPPTTRRGRCRWAGGCIAVGTRRPWLDHGEPPRDAIRGDDVREGPHHHTGHGGGSSDRSPGHDHRRQRGAPAPPSRAIPG